MANTSTQAKQITEMIEQARQATKKKTSTPEGSTVAQTKTDDKFSDIKTNTFYKIIFNEELAPEQKKEEVTKALTFKLEDTKEQNMTRLKEFTEFKEYLQFERKRMAQEIIKLTDTGAFSELKQVYDELNGAVIDFENRMTPLTDIIDAVYKLRLAGGETVLGVFKEIKQDQAAEEQRKKDLIEKQSRLDGLQSQIGNVNGDLAVLQNSRKHRKLFGFGGLKDEAIREIEAKKTELADIDATVAKTAQELENLKDPNKANETQYAQFAEQKNKLRELLDISSEEHKERQKALVGAAQNFVNSTSERVGSVLGHLDGMGDQIEGLFNVNSGMQSIYAIVSEGSREAAEANTKVRDTLQPPADGTKESAIKQMERESKKMAVEDHVSALGASTVDTEKTFADLSTQGFRIKSMKDSNREQIAKTRELHSSGVAGVADRLSTVLQAVSAAALNESAEMAKQTLGTMNDKTNKVAMQEAIRSAMGIKDTNDGLTKAIEDLQSYSEAIKATSAISREGLTEMKDILANLQEKTLEVQKEVKASIGIAAEVTEANGGVAKPAANEDKPAPKKPESTSSDPFKQFNR